MTQETNEDRLYNLLPAIYRQRDAETGWQLKALLRVIATQVNIVEDDIAQLYENWFIETCQDWVVPYIGDLIGYQQVHEAGEPGDVTTLQGQQRNKILIPRSEVANTLHYRRRRGTLSVLEQLGHDVAGWTAYAVEFYKQVGISQTLNYRHLERGRTIDIRNRRSLYYLDEPFGREAHTVDVRRPTSQHAVGRYNLPNVGLFLWRLHVYAITQTNAYCDEEQGKNCYTFSVLGNDVPLYTHPVTQGPFDELHVPNPITLHAFEERLLDFYGEDKSLYIWTIENNERPTSETHGPTHTDSKEHGHHHEEPHQRHGSQQSKPEALVAATQQELRPVTPDRIQAADLTDWKYRPLPGKVAVDPTLGRIVFPPGHEPAKVIVSFHYAFSADIGAGPYNRALLQQTPNQYYRVGKNETKYKKIQDALDDWNAWKTQYMEQTQLPYKPIIEIVDSGVYTEQLDIALEEYEHLYIRAANYQRPTIRLINWEENRSNSLKVSGEFGSRFTFDGLLVTGRDIETRGTITEMLIRHCTLVPGWDLDCDSEPDRPEEPGLSLYHVGERVTIEHSILGSILVEHDEVHEDPLPVFISDSIVDATSKDLSAISAPEDGIAPATLSITRSSVFGNILVHALELGENSIFNGVLTVARRQIGCMRFSFVTPGSRTPRRYNCQPDLVEQAVETRLKQFSTAEREAMKQSERNRVRPRFNSVRFGKPTYCQLALSCAIEIGHGADDESEMGVFHDLYQPQREAKLRARLDDFTPAGMVAGIIYVN